MTIGRKASRLVVAIKQASASRNTSVVDGTYDGYVRGVSDLPLAIPNNEDRPIIRPFSKTHWKDIPVVRKGRRPASVLTYLSKSNHPGILGYDGVKLRYKYEDAYSENAKQHVRRCFDEWCSEEWIAKSKKYRANRFSSNFKPHKGGSNSMTTISQKMAWVHTHRGVDRSTPLILNTPKSTKCFAKELNEHDYDILKNYVSSKALYDCSKGKPRGTWSLFNGIVNDIKVIYEVRATGTSSAALKRHRAEEIEDVCRKESEKTQKVEAYANNLLSWGVGMYEHCNGIHKFLQTLATNQGVPIGEIPLPPVQPPSRSFSPPGSPQRSTIEILENSEELPALCAQQETNTSSFHEHGVASSVPAVDDEGMFGGFFSQSGAGALSLSLLSSQLVP
ncbi:hypothetical protein VPH35_072466 [Triticum aestivum]